MKRFVYIIVTWSLLFYIAYSQAPEEIFNKANDLYRAGKYSDAINEYEKIIQQNYLSEELYFNLGNAYYRDGQLGKSILYFERALILKPNDPDIQHNLKLSYLKTIDRIEPVPEFFLLQWMRSIASFLLPETVITIFIISWILMFFSLTLIYTFSQNELIRIARITFLLSSIIVAFSIIMFGIQSFRDTATDKAIITEKVVTAKTSPDSQSIDAFVVHEGLKVKISDEVGGWVKIALPDGKIGWILYSQCERI